MRPVTTPTGATAYECGAEHLHDSATGAALCDLGERPDDRTVIEAGAAARVIAKALMDHVDKPETLERKVAGALEGLARTAAFTAREQERQRCMGIAKRHVAGEEHELLRELEGRA